MAFRFTRYGGYTERLDKSVRSNFEARIKKALERQGIPFEYESKRIPYNIEHTYKPDFVLPNGIFVEAKGLFLPSDRTKHLAVQKQHPELDIRFVFQRDQYLSKGSKTKYSTWCIKHNFKYHIGETIPMEWIKEKGKGDT